MTTTYVLRGRVTRERTLEVTLPPGTPEGEAEVTVKIEEAEPLRGTRRLLALLAEWEELPPIGRTAEEIEAYIQEARDAWD